MNKLTLRVEELELVRAEVSVETHGLGGIRGFATNVRHSNLRCRLEGKL